MAIMFATNTVAADQDKSTAPFALVGGRACRRDQFATALIIPATCYLLIATFSWSARHPA